MKDDHVSVPVTHEEDEASETTAPAAPRSTRAIMEIVRDLDAPMTLLSNQELRLAEQMLALRSDRMREQARVGEEIQTRRELDETRWAVSKPGIDPDVAERQMRIYMAGRQEPKKVDTTVAATLAHEAAADRINAFVGDQSRYRKLADAAKANFPGPELVAGETVTVAGYEPTLLQDATVSQLIEALRTAGERQLREWKRSPLSVGAKEVLAERLAKKHEEIRETSEFKALAEKTPAEKHRAAMLAEFDLISTRAWDIYSTLREDDYRASKTELQGRLAELCSLVSDLARAVKEDL